MLRRGVKTRLATLKAGSMHCLGLVGGTGEPLPWHDWWCSSCDLSQHAVQTPCHGYYYFHPYHLADLQAHQTVVTSWGGDARNPYDNAILKDVYTKWKSEQPDSAGATPAESPERPESSELPPSRSPSSRDEEGSLDVPNWPAPSASPAESTSAANGQAVFPNAPLLRPGR
jgi:hypothetical protein